MNPNESDQPVVPAGPDFSRPASASSPAADAPASATPKNPPSNPDAGREIPKPTIGYCRGTGKPITAEEATYVNGVLYSKEYASAHQLAPEPASPYAGGPIPPVVNSEVSPGWAFVLGLIPGVGAIYNQQYAKGLFHIVVLATLVTLLDRVHGAGAPFLGLLLAGWFFYMPFEAYHTAKRRQSGLPIEEFPGFGDMPPALRRVPIGPLLLILAGFFFLLDNFGLLHLEEALRFWPVLLIIAGAFLFVQRIQSLPPSGSPEERHVD